MADGSAVGRVRAGDAAVLSVVAWKWGERFGAEHVNRLRSMFERRLRLPHQVYCVTDDPAGIDPRVSIVPMPRTFAHTPRCRRRMQQFDAVWTRSHFGPRMLAVDLDIVLTDDITALVDRAEPFVGCWIDYAQVFSGSWILMDAGALHGLWEAYRDDPDGFPRRVQPKGTPSDQAMLNYWLAPHGHRIPRWTRADGFVTYFGRGYARHEHHGISEARPALPPGTKVVILGSADLHVLEQPETYPWVTAWA